MRAIKMSSMVLTLFCLAMTLALFQNCSPFHSTPSGSESSSSNSAPNGELKSSPSSTYLMTKSQILRTLSLHFNINVKDLNYSEPPLSISEVNKMAAVNSMQDADGYFSATEALVRDYFSSFLSCAASALDQACLERTIQTAGRKLFRRDLSSSEVIAYKQIANSQGAAQLSLGTQYAIVALLNSPFFLYQKFYGDSSGYLGGQEIAARLGFFLLGGNPDQGLLDAAKNGSLSTESGVVQQVDRILADQNLMGDLFANSLSQMWALNHLETSLSSQFYAEAFARLKEPVLTEFKMTAVSIYKNRKGDWRRVFDHDKTFVNKTLAENYGLSPVPASDSAWTEVSMPSPRSGLLSSGLVMAAHSGNKYTSTIHRGLFIQNKLFCQTIVAPADLNGLIARSGVVFSDDDTVIGRIGKISGNAVCASCHKKFDPYGIVMENFDNFGAFSMVRYGAPVVSQAVINSRPISSMPELSSVVLSDKNLPSCFINGLFAVATGMDVDTNVNLTSSYGLTSSQVFQFDAVVRALVLHPNFRRVQKSGGTSL